MVQFAWVPYLKPASEYVSYFSAYAHLLLTNRFSYSLVFFCVSNFILCIMHLIWGNLFKLSYSKEQI